VADDAGLRVTGLLNEAVPHLLNIGIVVLGALHVLLVLLLLRFQDGTQPVVRELLMVVSSSITISSPYSSRTTRVVMQASRKYGL